MKFQKSHREAQAWKKSNLKSPLIGEWKQLMLMHNLLIFYSLNWKKRNMLYNSRNMTSHVDNSLPKIFMKNSEFCFV